MTMTVLQIAKYLAPQISIETPVILASSSDTEQLELVNFMNSAGVEIATRYDWPQMRVNSYLTGAGNAPMTFAQNFSRLIQGRSVSYNGVTVRGGMSNEEFNRLVPVAGIPRYFRATPKTLELWPYIAPPTTVDVSYITTDWLVGGKSLITTDTDTPVFDEQLVIKGTLWRWRRHKGLDYKDHLDEFEAEMSKYTKFSSSERSP